jgi:hypothetical protein
MRHGAPHCPFGVIRARGHLPGHLPGHLLELQLPPPLRRLPGLQSRGKGTSMLHTIAWYPSASVITVIIMTAKHWHCSPTLLPIHLAFNTDNGGLLWNHLSKMLSPRIMILSLPCVMVCGRITGHNHPKRTGFRDHLLTCDYIRVLQKSCLDGVATKLRDLGKSV